MSNFVTLTEYMFDENDKATGEKRETVMNTDHIVYAYRRKLRCPDLDDFLNKEVVKDVDSIRLDTGETVIADPIDWKSL